MGQSPTWGRPTPRQVRLEIQLGVVACVKIWGGGSINGRNIVSGTNPLGLDNAYAYNLYVCGPKFTKFFIQ